ncbi:MAG: hypothetical protein Roseis3KO_14450 [Roseivirga sp.]
MASDHIDGPVTVRHPVADITDVYAFPSPDYPGRLVLVMDVYTGVAASGHFSDKVVYNFLVRHASIRGDGQEPGFDTQGNYQLSFSFETPHGPNTSHWVTCTSSNGTKVRVQVDDTHSFSPDDTLGVFAGRRSDPFFYNSMWGTKVIHGNITTPKDNNLLKHLNVLSIAVIIDIEQELDMSQGPLLAIAAQSTTIDDDNTTRQVDRLGRPEMTNIVMASKGREDIRTLYNEENTFKLNEKHAALYRERIHGNLIFFDSLNNQKDWSSEELNSLTAILLNDFLVIDTSRPYTQSSYFDIEYSILRGKPYTSPGGRSLNDDAIDVLFNMLVNGGKQPGITDGVTQATQPASETFPYLAPPNDGILAKFLAYVTRGVRYFTVDPAARWTGAFYFAPLILVIMAIIMLLVFVIRLRRHSPKLRMGLLLTMSILFILSGILGAAGHSLPIWAIVLFGIAGLLLLYFYVRYKKAGINRQ